MQLYKKGDIGSSSKRGSCNEITSSSSGKAAALQFIEKSATMRHATRQPLGRLLRVLSLSLPKKRILFPSLLSFPFYSIFSLMLVGYGCICFNLRVGRISVIVQVDTERSAKYFYKYRAGKGMRVLAQRYTNDRRDAVYLGRWDM